MAQKTFTVNQQHAAYMLGVDSRSIQSWGKRDIDPLPIAKRGGRGQPNEYDPAALVQWLVRYEVSKLHIEDGEVLDLNAERAKLARLQAKKVQLDIDERESRLFPPDELLDLFTKAIMGSRAHFLAMPARWAPLLTGIQSVPEMANKLQDAVYQALDEMSVMEIRKLLQLGSDADG